METIATRFRASARTTHNLWAVVTTAMLLALNTVLTLFVRVQITPDLRISFGFMAIAMIGMLFGPASAASSNSWANRSICKAPTPGRWRAPSGGFLCAAAGAGKGGPPWKALDITRGWY